MAILAKSQITLTDLLDGIDGAPGTSSYFHVKYAPVQNPTAAQMSDEVNSFIGTYVDDKIDDSNDPLKYQWVRIEGIDGEQGIPGKDGASGQTSYLHVKYSDNVVYIGGVPSGDFTANNGETPGAFIGQYVDFSVSDSNKFTDYKWYKIKGDQGPIGPEGVGYTINITGGTRGIAYAADGTGPSPATSTEFTAQLLKNGKAQTTISSCSWSVGGVFTSGTVGSTNLKYTPRISATVDTKNIPSTFITVSIKPSATEDAVVQTVPIVVTANADGLDWLADWNSGKTTIKDKSIASPRIFAGENTGTENAPKLSGVALGKDVLAGSSTQIGLVGYQENRPTFKLGTDGTFLVSKDGSSGGVINGGSAGIYFDGTNLSITGNVAIKGGSIGGSGITDIVNGANNGTDAKNELDNLQISGRNLILKSMLNIQNNTYLTTTARTSVELVGGKKYTAVLKGQTSGGQKIGIWMNSGSNNVVYFPVDQNGVSYTTFTAATPNSDNHKTLLSYCNYPSSGSSANPARIEWIALYEGEVKPSLDWTPAPEDVDSAINDKVDNKQDAIFNKLFANGTQGFVLEDGKVYINGEVIKANAISGNSIKAGTITANHISADGITANKIKAGILQATSGGSYLNLNDGSMLLGSTTAANYLQWDGAKLAIKASSILIGSESVATSSSLDKAINDIEIGGRNLLENSNREVHKNGLTNGEFVQFGDVAPVFDKHGLIEYTISFDLKVAKDGLVKVYMHNGSGAKYFIGDHGIQATTTYTRYSITVTPKIANASLTTSQLAFYGVYGTGVFPFIKDVKIEKGNKATDYTIAPEDVTNEITTKVTEAKAEIKIETDKITQNVSNLTTTVNSKADGSTVTALSNKVSSIEQTTGSISSKVTGLEQTTDTLNGKVTNQESRLFSAEQKITPDAIKNTVEQQVNANGSTVLASKSDITQTANDITFKFSQSGGANLLRNSRGESGDTRYWTTGYYNGSGGSPAGWNFSRRQDTWTMNRLALQLQCANTNGGELRFEQQFDTVVGKTYTLSGLIAGHRSNKNVYARRTDGSWGWLASVGYGEIYGGEDINSWQKLSLTFTAQDTRTDIVFGMSTTSDDGYIWLLDAMISEGSVAIPWSPHAEELVNGSTVIDGSGVTINNGAIRVNNNSGQTVLSGDANGNLTVTGDITGSKISGSAINGGTITGADINATNIKCNRELFISFDNGISPQINFKNMYGNSAGWIWGSESDLNLRGASNVNIPEGDLHISQGRLVATRTVGTPSWEDNTLELRTYPWHGSGTVSLNFHRQGHTSVSLWHSTSNNDSATLETDGNLFVYGKYGLQVEGGWLRTTGQTGWYNQTYGGGWYMTDDSFIRNYNNKGLAISGADVYCNRYTGETSSNTYIGGGGFRVEANADNHARLYTSWQGHPDCGLFINANGSLIIRSYNTLKHAFYDNGTKTGGTIEIEGTTYGMSPTDSPQTLIEYIEFDVEVDGEMEIMLKPIYSKSVTKYAVFSSNPNIQIVKKLEDRFIVTGTGVADFNIKGQRIEGQEDYIIMGGFEHGEKHEVVV